MIEQQFYVEPATWTFDHEAIRAIRSDVFIIEQQLPEDDEFDRHDRKARHFLARDNETRAIGTIRLVRDGCIGRLAVHKSWRGRGVGRALLRSAIEDARSRNLPKIRLAAQTRAIGFYRKFGFKAYGKPFNQAQIAHQWMKLSPGKPETGPVGRVSRKPAELQHTETLKFERIPQLSELLLDLMRACRNELAIWTRDLDGPVLDDDAMLEEIKQLAVAAPRPVIRILVLDSARAVHNDHRLLQLANRLPSTIHIQRAGPDHRDYVPAFVVADRIHSIYREFGDQPRGLLQPNDHIFARRLMAFFDLAWEQSEIDPQLRRLDL